MKPKKTIDRLEIENFRGIKELRIKHLGDVTLLVGKNGSGKTTVLEAVSLLLSDDPILEAARILASRGEIARFGELASSTDVPRLPIEALFTSDSAVAPEAIRSLRITAGAKSKSLVINLTWASRRIDSNEDEVVTLLRQNAKPDPLVNQRVISVIQRGRLQRVLPVENFNSTLVSRLRRQRELYEPRYPRIRVVRVVPGGMNSDDLYDVWDRVALTPLEERVLDGLRVVVPEVEKIASVNISEERLPSRGSRNDGRQFIVRLRGRSAPVPLASLGDGATRVLGIVLALVGASDGVALIDEIENGIHYSIMPKLWRTIFSVARELGVQVVAATHSYDCIRSFEKTASADRHMDGHVLRLERNEAGLTVTSFSEKELAIAASADIEIR